VKVITTPKYKLKALNRLKALNKIKALKKLPKVYQKLSKSSPKTSIAF
jgi:hypothetical protein